MTGSFRRRTVAEVVQAILLASLIACHHPAASPVSARTLCLEGRCPGMLQRLNGSTGPAHRFDVVLLVRSHTCPRQWDVALGSLIAAVSREHLDTAVTLALEGGKDADATRQALFLGLNQNQIIEDDGKTFSHDLGLSSFDLPIWLTLDTLGEPRVIMEARLSPVGDEQELAGTLLATLHSFSGGIRP